MGAESSEPHQLAWGWVPEHRGQVGGGGVWGGRGWGFTSKVEGAVDAHCWLLLELPQAFGGSFVHHQVQGLV